MTGIFCLGSSVRRVCTCDPEGLLAGSFWVSRESFPGFSMAMIFDCLHIVGGLVLSEAIIKHCKQSLVSFGTKVL